MRAAVFNHLAGIVLAPTVKALSDRRVFELFESPSASRKLDEVVEKTHANRGYMRVALRLLASCGWLKQRNGDNGQSPSYELTSQGNIALKMAPLLHGEVASFVSKAVFLEDFLYGKTDGPVLPSLQELVRRSRECWGIRQRVDPIEATVCNQVRRQLDGMLIGPSMVALARGGVLAQLEQGSVELCSIPANRASLAAVVDLLSYPRLGCA